MESTHKTNLPQMVFTSEQATLLHFIAALLNDKDATSYVDIPHSEIREGEQPPLLMPEGVLAFLLDTTSVVAARFEAAVDDDERKVALSILMECVSILRAMSEREVKPHAGDTVACLAAMGLVRLTLSLLAALPAPEGIGQTSKATGPAAAPKLKQSVPEELKSDVTYPSRVPWSGYRVDLIAIIGNAAFNRARVCDDVANLGGLPIVLNHTRGEEGEAYLREWALWAVRNLTQSSELARSKIAELQPQAVEESEELLSRSLGVELNRETGRPRVVRREQMPIEDVAARRENDDAEPAIPTNWKVTEL
jgi:ataxin-10